jgi:predicted TIM-barrel fold metal-dependent hydrolase
MTEVSVSRPARRATATTRSAKIRADLAHPIIDSDGHILEFEPAVLDKLEEIAGRDIRDRYGSESFRDNVFDSFPTVFAAEQATQEERLKWRMVKGPWWAASTSTAVHDRAASMLPGYLYERLDETGMDFSILFPSLGLAAPHLDNAEFRRAGCRAYNAYCAEVIGPYADRLTGVAVIPMHTPQEAVEELEYAVRVQGFKVVTMPSYIVRPVPGVVEKWPEAAKHTHWNDSYGIDSLYDYDPVWAKCVELGVAPTFHTPGYGFTRGSVSNWMMNHIGLFAAGGEGITRSLFMSGVPHRFPSLRFGILEGGAGFAASLYSDLIGHWSKRNADMILNYDPSRLDVPLLQSLFAKYGGPAVQKRLDRVGKTEWKSKAVGGLTMDGQLSARDLDEFNLTGVERKEDFKRLYVERFFFGCEADDPINAWAFNDKVNPMGAKLKAVLASDIGHFDVTDITEIAEEAYEGVEHGLMSQDDFRAFVFENPVDLWTAGNPDFFKGTVVEAAVDKRLKEKASKAAAR